MDTEIVLEQSDYILDAFEWATEQIKGQWYFDTKNILSDSPQYVFTFENSVEATYFALKWL